MRKLDYNELFNFNGGAFKIFRYGLWPLAKSAWNNRKYIKQGYKRGERSRTGLEGLK